ncbi:MAG: gliding motility-associated C-terminal domain-containing protein [Cytophagales bacterium]|nr:gliding motility-associated C-terminal domain-containing protein [Cytophagales bacterium]
MRLSVLLILFATQGLAQQFSQVGRFSVEHNRGCAPFTVNLNIEDDFGNIIRQYFYEGASTQTIDTFYTYNTPGTYEIVQLIGVDVDPKTDTLFIEVLDPVIPAFGFSICEGNEVQVTIQDVGYEEYLVQFTNTDEVIVPASDLTANFSYPNTGTQSILVQGRFLNAANNCGFSRQSLEIQAFENQGTIDNLELIRSCIDNLSARLQFSLSTHQSYELMLSENGTNFSTIANPTPADPQIELSNISNSTNASLFFRLDALSDCSGLRIAGEVMEVENPIASLPSLENAYVSWNDQGINFRLDDIGAGEYTARKRVPGFDWELLDTLFNGYTDPYVSDFRIYEYEVSFADTCGNNVPTVTLSPAFISYRETDINTYEISWIPPVNTLNDAFFHEMVITGNSNRLVIENPLEPQKIFLTEPQGAIQILSLETIYRFDTLRSNPKSLMYKFHAYLPDAFTPNNDFLNDELRILGITATEVDFKVFNRWGELIHVTSNKNPAWDGQVRGEPAPEGKYYYRLSFLSIENKRIEQRGSFVLLR